MTQLFTCACEFSHGRGNWSLKHIFFFMKKVFIKNS